MYNQILAENSEWISKTWEKVEGKLSKTAIKSRNKLPYTTVNGIHDDKNETDPAWWTNGFWGGMMWLMYEMTKKEDYRITAEKSEELLDKALFDYKSLHHDVGFMWHLTSVANYRLTGSEKSMNRGLFAAASLASRYNIDGKFIRAWNENGVEGWSIIDCLMNVPLLYWATDEIEDDRFKKIAMAHTDMAMRDHLRDDGSVNHIAEHDLSTGECVKVYGGQGYKEGSCWSRGLAWAVYGFTLGYIHTKKAEYLDSAKKAANYFILNCAKDGYKTVVDFTAPPEPVYYDSTAGVCTACGLLRLAEFVTEQESKMYTEAAINILKATDENFCDYTDKEDALVLMGTERYPIENMKGVHIPIIYGDFFFIEALSILKGSKFLIW